MNFRAASKPRKAAELAGPALSKMGTTPQKEATNSLTFEQLHSGCHFSSKIIS